MGNCITRTSHQEDDLDTITPFRRSRHRDLSFIQTTQPSPQPRSYSRPYQRTREDHLTIPNYRPRSNTVVISASVNVASNNERRVIITEFIDLVNDIRLGTGSTEQPKINCDNLTCVQINDANKPDDVCSICLNEFKSGETACKLQCYHHFHKICIAQWFDKNSTCPICKFNVSNM